MASMRNESRFSPVRMKLERFWRWWAGELMSMAPALAGATRAPLVALEGSLVRVLEPALAQGTDQVDRSDMDPGRAASEVRALLERAGESRGSARLAIGERDVLVRRVVMPAATEENLGSVLGFEMDRLTPFGAADVYYDHRIVARDPAAGTLTVLLAVGRREVVDAGVEQLRQLGVSVRGVEVREEKARSGPALDLLPSTQRGEREGPRERLVKQVLAGAVIVLLLAALAIPALRKRSEVHAVKPALDKALAEAQATDALIRDLDRQTADYNFLLARKHGAPPTLAFVEEVTRLLPDNTWLMQFDIKPNGKVREVQLSGETVSASKLIEVLEQSQLLQNAAPRGTITRGAMPGSERFVIAAEARARPLPEPRPISEVASAPPPPVAPAPATPVVAPPAAPQPAAPATATVTPMQGPGPAPTVAPGEALIFKPRGRQAVDPALQPAPKGSR